MPKSSRSIIKLAPNGTRLATQVPHLGSKPNGSIPQLMPKLATRELGSRCLTNVLTFQWLGVHIIRGGRFEQEGRDSRGGRVEGLHALVGRM